MESTCSENNPFYKRIRFFPTITNDKLNIMEFLDATTDLVSVVEPTKSSSRFKAQGMRYSPVTDCGVSVLDQLGRAFAPVKYDMQGNIDKIKKGYNCVEAACLLSEIKNDIESGTPRVAEGVVWLNRSILFFEIVFQEIIKCLRSNNIDVAMKKIFTVAYEGSVKHYHNWVTQQIFLMITRLSPRLPQMLASLGVHNMNELETYLSNYITSLTPVRCAIDNVLKINNMY